MRNGDGENSQKKVKSSRILQILFSFQSYFNIFVLLLETKCTSEALLNSEGDSKKRNIFFHNTGITRSGRVQYESLSDE